MLARIFPIAILVCLTFQPLNAAEPEASRPDPASGGLDVHTYTASFRGEGGKTRVEVYTGVSPKGLAYVSTDEDSVAELETEIVLCDTVGAEVFQNVEAVWVQQPPPDGGSWLVPGMAALDLTPGSYDMTLRLKDRLSGRMHIIRQKVKAVCYESALLTLSDIEVGVVLPDPNAGKSFVKNGTPVVPMASRLYRKGQSLAVYFEVYNLILKAGTSAYRVEYTVRSTEDRQVGVKVLSGLGKLGMGRLVRLTEDGSEVTIACDLSGTAETGVGYIELNLDRSETGPQELTVTVTDTYAGRTASKSILFGVDTR